MTTTCPATAADFADIVAMQREFYVEDAYPYDDTTMPPALAALLRDPALGRGWLATRGGQPVGYLLLTYGYSVERGGRMGLVDELYVRPEARGQGIGSRLLATAEAHCREAGIRTLLLEVERGNMGARRLYERLGFEAYDRDLMDKAL